MLLKNVQINGGDIAIIDLRKYADFIRIQINNVSTVQEILYKIAKVVKSNVLNKDVWYDDKARDFALKAWNNLKGDQDEGINGLYNINKTIVGLTDIVVGKLCAKLMEMPATRETARKYNLISKYSKGTIIEVEAGTKIEKITINKLNEFGYIDTREYPKFPICENEKGIDLFIKQLQRYMTQIFDETKKMETNISKYILNKDTAVISFKSDFNKTILKRKVQYINKQLNNIDKNIYYYMSAMVEETNKTIKGLKAIYETDWINKDDLASTVETGNHSNIHNEENMETNINDNAVFLDDPVLNKILKLDNQLKKELEQYGGTVYRGKFIVNGKIEYGEDYLFLDEKKRGSYVIYNKDGFEVFRCQKNLGNIERYSEPMRNAQILGEF